MKKKLIRESRCIWLFSIFLYLFLASAFIIYGKSTVLMTMGYMILGALPIIIFESIFITYEILKKYYKCLGILLFYLIVLCENRFKYIDKWYVIVPMFIILSLYIFWFLEGFRNCVVISEMEPDLTELIGICRRIYPEYKTTIEEYNREYCLIGRKSVKIKEEPNWKDYEFNYGGYDMFFLSNVMNKRYIRDIHRKEITLRGLRENMEKDIDAVKANFQLIQEQEIVKELSNQNYLSPVSDDPSIKKLEKMRKSTHKKVNKLLRRKWK